MIDAALQCLFYPFATGALDYPAPGSSVLFLNAAPCPELRHLPASTVCQQHFRPDYDRLQSAGCRAEAEVAGGSYDAVMLRAPRQIQEMQFFIAHALINLKTGGLLVVSAANDAGGTRLGKLLEKAGLKVSADSKYKARVVWASKPETVNDMLLQDWLKAGSLQPVMEDAYVSRPGLFSWDRIDRGSAMLARHLPVKLGGAGADFGCGFGFLTREILGHCSDISEITCIDADFRALEACRSNVAGVREGVRTEFLWEDIPASDLPLKGLHWVAMNPPFHTGKQQNIQLGASCIAAAAKVLRCGGALYMVSNVHLPYEQALRSSFRTVTTLYEGEGYKIHKAVK